MENENKVILNKEMMGDLIKFNKVVSGLWVYITPEGDVCLHGPYNAVLMKDRCINGTGVYIFHSNCQNSSKGIKSRHLKNLF